MGTDEFWDRLMGKWPDLSKMPTPQHVSASVAPTILTSPTCRFKTGRTGLHKPIARVDRATGQATCYDCLLEMQRSLSRLFDEEKSGPAFCHECGFRFKVQADEARARGEADIPIAVHYRDTEAVLLCPKCDKKHGAKISGEVNAAANERLRLVMASVEARQAIADAPVAVKQSLYERFLARLGHRRHV